METSRDAHPDERLVDALVQAAFATTAVLTRIGATHDLSLTQMRVLGILQDRRLRVGVLAAHLGLEKSTLSGLVDRAVARGLVERAPNAEDGRVVDVFLTAGGLVLADHVHAEVARALAPRTDALDAGRRASLTEALEVFNGPSDL